MKKKLNKFESDSLLNNLTDVETNVNYKGNFVEMNVMGKLIQKKDKEISLNSIYELMTTFKMEVNQRFESIDKKFDSLETKIKLVKKDVKNLDNKLSDVI